MRPVRNALRDNKNSFALAFYIPVILICTFAMLVISSGHVAYVQNDKDANSQKQRNMDETIDKADQIKKHNLMIDRQFNNNKQIDTLRIEDKAL